MREIVLDTETTGLDPAAGHRVVEIAALELLHHVPTGRTFREFLNPERDMPPEAERIHGISAEFLKDKPVFKAIAPAFLDFLGDARLIIHNAAFDMKFLNAELSVCGLGPLGNDRAVCTVTMARQRFPGAQVSLDALCRRFAIDNSARTFHGALLDCELLAEVYLELCGGRQPGLILESRRQHNGVAAAAVALEARPARVHPLIAEEEAAAHAAMLEKLSNPVWRT
jgi:DNA polymerase III subunit epsilon